MDSLTRPLSAAIALALAASTYAQSVRYPGTDTEPAMLEAITVEATRLVVIGTETRDDRDITPIRPATSDTAALLRDVPGTYLNSAGGVSSLPSIHGLADDRLRIQLDGMSLISACANHMNPPLSYIDPTAVEELTVYPGITPVSVGGDSIGGTIIVKSRAPRFATGDQTSLVNAEVGTFYRSNGDSWGVNASASAASRNLSIRYSGSVAQANNYHAATAFKPDTTLVGTIGGSMFIPGDTVGSSAYRSDNHAVDVAFQHGANHVELKLGYQHVPRQGFPNQHMDMTDNESRRAGLTYGGTFSWGKLNVGAYTEHTQHQMDFGPDKLYWYTAPNTACSPIGPMCVAGMPMTTEGRNTGVKASGEIPLTSRDKLTTGVEYQRYRLDDRWAPSGGMMMWPNEFININDGRRDHADLFVEWEARWSLRWMTLAGVRGSRVTMDSGPVQGYSSMYDMMPMGHNAMTFNMADRGHTDDNLDVTTLARYTFSPKQTYEFGYARKVRSPNLYERYAWSGNGMAMTMNNWVNDGNGYVGNINLKPEIAHTLSATGDWRGGANPSRGAKLTVYYNRVDDYIDAACANLSSCALGKFNYLTLVNQDARLYGADLSAFATLGAHDARRSLTLRGSLSYVNGENRTTGDHLYNVMPLNARFVLEYQRGKWSMLADEQVVLAKDRVSAVRSELTTGGYTLLNLRGSYDWGAVRFDVGLENALNRMYALPTGGAYIGQGKTMSLNGAGTPYGLAMPGPGRSVYVGLSGKL
ncbi:MAG: TonB-dependent receptor plug domain-containing protein [Proteobacteria bacterium]|nr:TonB-dependent receptor plug domain-containing protein [Pseudomonadota bacterium]